MSRFSSLSRAFVASALLVVVALVSSACNKGAAPAAKINGTELSTSRVLAGARLWGQLPVDSSGTVTPVDKSKVPTTLIASYLNTQMSWHAIHEVALKNGVRPTAAELAAAGTTLQQQLTGANKTKSWKQLPPWFQAQLELVSVEITDLQKKLANGDDGSALALQTYNSSKASFTTYCLDALLTVKKADAASALAKVRGGATFSSVAKATAKASGAQAAGTKNDGDLGCSPLQTFQSQYNFDANLLTDIGASADGDLLGPVSYQGAGYLVVRLRSRKVPTFAEVKAQIIASQTPPGQEAMTKAVTAKLLAAKVEINPRFGTWVNTGTQAGVVAPTGSDAAPVATATTVAPAAN